LKERPEEMKERETRERGRSEFTFGWLSAKPLKLLSVDLSFES
jgi:hypothetical protein